jgi:hypothetical protein
MKLWEESLYIHNVVYELSEQATVSVDFIHKNQLDYSFNNR